MRDSRSVHSRYAYFWYTNEASLPIIFSLCKLSQPRLLLLLLLMMMMISSAPALSLVLFFISFSLASPPHNAYQRREICYANDVLLSFQEWRDDSVPYCSALLNIQDVTTFVGPAVSHTYVSFFLSFFLSIRFDMNERVHFVCVCMAMCKCKCADDGERKELPSAPSRKLSMMLSQ